MNVVTDISITIKRTKDLLPAARQQINMLTQEEFGRLDIVRRYQWADPDWMAIANLNREIVSFAGLLARMITMDERQVKIAGVNNAVTPQEHRGKGYASALLSHAYEFMFKDLRAEHALLLCRDHLVEFYEKLGWYKISCPVQFTKPDSTKEIWVANAMLYTPANEARISPKFVDLRGYPW